MKREYVTLALDLLGLLLLAAGLGVVVAQIIGPGCGFVVSGLVVLGGRWWADKRTAPAPERPGERL